jgi:uncharacterized protein (TIGR00303 family)
VRVVLVAGNTQTARIDGISAAGADPDVMVHTPSADLEIVAYGQPTSAPVVPVSPSGCPTPAVVTRSVREHLGFDLLAVDAGLASSTTTPTVDVGDAPGDDIRQARAVPSASDVFESARDLGESLPDEAVFVGETIPGGTTTALGVLTALGERATVSSSLPDNPLSLKHSVVEEGLSASELSPGGAAGEPLRAVEAVGDPVLAGVSGLVTGAIETGTSVTLAGGTQMAAAAALVRHAGIEAPLELATTSFVAEDDTAALAAVASDLDLAVTVTDPGFERASHPAMDAYVAGEAKEGVGMGGALALADQRDVSMAAIRATVAEITERLSETPPEPDP